MSLTMTRDRTSENALESALENLPALTHDTLQRVREGVAAARDEAVREAIAHSLTPASRPRHAPGWLRRGALRLGVRALFRVRVENPEYMPQGAAVLACNHLSHFDPLILLAELPATPYYHCLGDARSLFNRWWKRLLLGWAGGVLPLERRWREETAVLEAAKAGRQDLAPLAEAIARDVPTGGSIQSMRQIDRAIGNLFDNDDGLLIFPEGRLGDTEGQLAPLKRGTVLYALRYGVPIVPACLVGTKHLFFRKQLTLRFGEPILVGRSKRPKAEEIDRTLETLQTAISNLLPADYQEPTGFQIGRRLLRRLLS